MLRTLAAAFLLIAAPSALAAAATVQAQDRAQNQAQPQDRADRYTLAHDFAQGDRFSYRIQLTLTTEQSTDDRTFEKQTLSADATMRFTVDETMADGGAMLTARVTQARIRMQIGEAAPAAMIAVPSPAMAPGAERSPADAAAAALGSADIRFRVAADGTVSDLTGTDEYIRVVEQNADSLGAAVTAFFAPRDLTEMLSKLFSVDNAAGAVRRVGDDWQASRTIELPPVAVLDISDKLRLDAVSEGVATILGQTDATLRRPATPDDTRPTIALRDASGSIVTRFDLDADHVLQRIETRQMDVTWGLGDLSLEQTSQSLLQMNRVE